MDIYKNSEYIGYVKFLKNKGMYGIYFDESNLYANTLIGVNGLDEYLDNMGFQNEHEVWTI